MTGVQAALIGLASGLAAGAVMARWGLCFNRGVRRAFLEHRPRVLRAFAIAVAVQLLLLPLLVGAGVAPLERSAEAAGCRCCRSPSSPAASCSGPAWRSRAAA